MQGVNPFYGFRGNIVFPNQATIFNFSLENNSSSKNSIFRDFFSMIEKQKKLESHYKKRTYFLIFKNKYNDILHCQLARKKQFNKRDIVDDNIIELEDKDYPYVNIFVDLIGQKFLIESNTQVFENYNTCSSVMENIINTNLNKKDIGIVLNPIIEEKSFWSHFEEGNKIYKIEFKLTVPNMFDTENDVTTLLKEAEKNTGSDGVDITFKNSKGNLKPNRVGFDSYVRYISDGGGKWNLTKIDDRGKEVIIKSEQKSIMVNISIPFERLITSKLDAGEIKNIESCFDNIENLQKFKRGKNDE